MQTTTVIAALVSGVVFAVGGYVVGMKSGAVKTSHAHPHVGKNCRGGDCNVTITFACDDVSHPTTATCEPYADQEVIIMDTGHKMKFTIDNNNVFNNFSFDQTDGIKFTSSNSSTYLPCNPQGSSGKIYSCENNIPGSTGPDVYKYQIHITGFSVVDPFMVNY